MMVYIYGHIVILLNNEGQKVLNNWQKFFKANFKGYSVSENEGLRETRWRCRCRARKRSLDRWKWKWWFCIIMVGVGSS